MALQQRQGHRHRSPQPGKRSRAIGLAGDYQDLSVDPTGLRWLLDDRAECEKMGATGRQVALEEYSADRQVERMLSIYEELMKKEPGS